MTRHIALLIALTACVDAYALPKVVILATGGTISGYDPVRSAYMPVATGEELVPAVPKLKEIAEIQLEQVTAINSADMTTDIWIQLANRLQRVLDDPGISGAVITHGTNTIEETAYFLDLVLTSSKPVVLVGAQRPALDLYSDGPLNLLQAVEVAVNTEARGKDAWW
jgi:L-asparaginase